MASTSSSTTPTSASVAGAANPPSARTTVRRMGDRGHYEPEVVHEILDAALLCHLGFTPASGPVVIPTLHGRDGAVLYVHGSPASRMLRNLRKGLDVCVTATVVDGLVLARSTVHHSVNYRSAVVFGQAQAVTDPEEKLVGLRAISEHVLPGRWAEARPPRHDELRGVHVLAMPLTEASAKVRTGPASDEEGDYGLPVWAGELPLSTVVGEPVAEPWLAPGIEVPPSIRCVTGRSVVGTGSMPAGLRRSPGRR